MREVLEWFPVLGKSRSFQREAKCDNSLTVYQNYEPYEAETQKEVQGTMEEEEIYWVFSRTKDDQLWKHWACFSSIL
jgi:hypothetical protein